VIRRELLAALAMTVLTLVVTGIVYPLAVTGVASALFPYHAAGSIVTEGPGQAIGSELIAQPFSAAGYLQSRPSAAGEKGYDGAGSSGSNLGPTSKALRERVEKELRRLVQENPDATGPVPAELVSASASGLDPHLSPAAALWQVPRIARARNVDEARVRTVIEANVEGRDLGVLGEARVNVLLVNRALDRHFGQMHSAAEH
jgi:K+-transporting ATPase ATPase C chain